MKPAKYAWLGVVLLAAGCRTQAPVAASSDESFWTARAAQIQVGMRREEVEGILELRYEDIGYNAASTNTGGSQNVVYRVAPGYRVVVIYDYTGGPTHPDNRVLHPARLDEHN